MTILIFVIVLAVLVLAHELGHFIAAKQEGLLVEEFGFGFPPRIFSWKYKETVYSLNLLPLGGFVKILGEDGIGTDNPKSFASKSPGRRALITIGGVLMNFLLSIFILIIGFNIGLPQALDPSTESLARNVQIQIVLINPDSPAEKAGLMAGDVIRSIKIENKMIFVNEIPALQKSVSENKGKKIILEILRGKENLEFKVIPRINAPEGEGPLGIALAKTGIIYYPWYQSIWLGIKTSFELTWMIILGFLKIIKDLIVTGKLSQDISGPVGVAVLTGQASQLGFIYLLNLIALISLNLTVLNLLPFPALDGGRLLFIGIEKIKGSKVNPKVENFIHSIGLALLLALALLVTWHDILKLTH